MVSNVTKMGLEKRAEDRGNAPRPQSKGERQKEMAAKMVTPLAPIPAPAPAKVEAKVETKTEKPADTPAVAPGTTPDKPKAKRVKKSSGHYVLYRKHVKDVTYPLTAKITVLKKDTNPKRRGAAIKFALYKDGMTVGEYIDASAAAGTSKRVAMADVKWDHTANFISVEGVTI
jgi:hypothetical protein